MIVAVSTFARLHDMYRQIKVCGATKLLGVIVGPLAGDDSWAIPLRKLQVRAKGVRAAKLGLNRTAFLFNQLAFSTLSHVCQFV